MANQVKPYNHSYKIAYRYLKENPKIPLGFLSMYVITHLDKKYNYSKEGVKWAWNDFKKKKNVPFNGYIHWHKAVYPPKHTMSYTKWRKHYINDLIPIKTKWIITDDLEND